jgi:hypothetical protein
MKRYVEASPRARQWLFLVAVVWAGLVLFASRFSTYFPLPTGAQELLAQIDARALYGLVALSLFYLALSAMAIFVAIRVVRTRQWPPAGMAVPFRTPVREIRKPAAVWLSLAILLLVYAAQIVMAAYTTTATHSMVQEALRLVGPKP